MSDKKFSLVAVLKADNSNFKRGMKGAGGTLNTFMLKATGAFAGFKGAQVLKDTALEAVELAGEAQGVEAAFAKINNPALLSDIRRATKGTIDDLQLMKYAVQAKNFKIPLDQLATYFKFATNRAAETGEEVDYLVNSLITGLGRKSALVMDNLGISAKELQEETKKMGDFGAAAGKIIQAEMAAAGEVMKTDAQRAAELSANLENQKVILGQKLLPVYHSILVATNKLITTTGTATERFEDEKNKVYNLTSQLQNSQTSQKNRISAYKELQRIAPSVVEGISLENIETGKLVKNLAKYNELTIKKIALSDSDEALAKQREAAGQAAGKRMKIEQDLEKLLIKMRDATNKHSSEYGQAIDKILISDQSLIEKKKEVGKYIQSLDIYVKGYGKSMTKANNLVPKYVKSLEDEKTAMLAVDEALKQYVDMQSRLSAESPNIVKAIEDEKKAIATKINTISTVSAKISELQELQKTATGEELADLNRRIKKWQEFRAELQNLGLNAQNTAFSINEVVELLDDLDDVVIDDIAPDLAALSSWDLLKNNLTSTDVLVGVLSQSINGLTDSFTALFAGTDAGFKEVVTAVLKSTQQIINMFLAQAIAAVILDGAKYGGLIGALAAGTVGLSALMGVWQSSVPKFAAGGIFNGSGIVPGTQYAGDSINAKLNSGEMVLNGNQQKNLMNLINNGSGGAGGIQHSIKIKGRELEILLRNVATANNSMG